MSTPPAPPDRLPLPASVSEIDRVARVPRESNGISPKEIGIGIACAVGVGYALKQTFKNKPPTPQQPEKPQPRHLKSPDKDDISLPHQVILFLKLLLPVVLASDPPPKAQATIDASGNATELPEQYQKDAAPQIVHAARGSRFQQAWQLVKAAVNAWIDDFAPSMGAAIAYYTMFSIAPMLVIAIAVAGAGAIFGQEAAQGEIVAQLRGIIGEDGAVAIQALLQSASQPTEGIIATGISIVTLAIGSTAVFAELQSALDRIWRMPVAVKEGGIWNLIRTRLLSFGLILGLGFMLMVSLVVSAGLAALGNWWGSWFEGWGIVLQILNLVISFFVFAGMFSVIYKFMPRVRLSWRDVWIGAVATTVLFIIGKYLIGLYLGTTGMSTGFGAAGSFALLLAWIYYSAQIFLLGAEFTWIYANNYGSKAKGALPA